MSGEDIGTYHARTCKHTLDRDVATSEVVRCRGDDSGPLELAGAA